MGDQRVRWADLRPDEFVERRRERPVALLPMGICEPHGHVAALGLDTHLADWVCDRAAARAGGIVAPTQGYHIHESGYHAQWLEEVVGEHEALLGGMPPHVICLHFLYQLRVVANAGFRAAIVVTGHVGGNERDLQRWADAFTGEIGLPVLVTNVAELSGEPGDHAGRFELSALLYARPELVDMALLGRMSEPGSGGRLALGEDAGDASAVDGNRIMETALSRLSELIATVDVDGRPVRPVTYEPVEAVYRRVVADAEHWETLRPRPGQPPVTAASQWHPYEHPLTPETVT